MAVILSASFSSLSFSDISSRWLIKFIYDYKFSATGAKASGKLNKTFFNKWCFKNMCCLSLWRLNDRNLSAHVTTLVGCYIYLGIAGSWIFVFLHYMKKQMQFHLQPKALYLVSCLPDHLTSVLSGWSISPPSKYNSLQFMYFPFVFVIWANSHFTLKIARTRRKCDSDIVKSFIPRSILENVDFI